MAFTRILILSLTLTACSSPSQRFALGAQEFGFLRQFQQGVGYRHTLFSNGSANTSGELHVYLDGDGVPWLRRNLVAADPTPRNPLVLRLMAGDSAPSVYLGRPCYHHSESAPPACSPWLWTHGRYSPAVVDSMASALDSFLDARHTFGLVFIGYSGGGVLALLLAERFPQTRAVVTIAGNLDIDAWTDLHEYSKLRGSLNPAIRPGLNPEIVQLHYAGQRDRNVPPRIVEGYASRFPQAQFRSLAGFDHDCCWEKAWPEILEHLAAVLSSPDDQSQ